MWSYIIDGIFILILVICAIVGIVKGFFDSLLSLIGTGLSLVIGVFTAKYVSNWLNKIINIEKFILDKLDSVNEGTVTFFGKTFTNVEVSKFCVWLITVLVIFLICKLVLYILAKIFESVSQSSPTISGINRVLGMIFGLCKGAVILFGALSLCSALAPVPGIGPAITDKIAETKVTSFVYKYVDDFVNTQLTPEKIDEIVKKIITENSTENKDNTEKAPEVENTPSA